MLTLQEPGRMWRASLRTLVLCFVVLSAVPLSSQVVGDTVPPDTVPDDTIVGDTLAIPIPPDLEAADDTVPSALAEAAAADSVIPRMPVTTDTLAAGWGSGRWIIDGRDIASIPGMTLLEIIEQIPGVVGFRAGGFGRPEGITALGFGGSRVRIFVDDIELVPIGSGSFEIESIPLSDIDQLEISRQLDGIRIEIRTYRLRQPEAHSAIHLGTGVYQTRLLDAIFSRGIGSRSVGTAVFDLSSTNGFAVAEQYSHRSVIARYAFGLTENSGIQAEFRQMKFDRRGTRYLRRSSRQEMSLIASTRLGGAVLLRAIAARSTQIEETQTADLYSFATNQLGGTLGFSSPAFEFRAGGRGYLGSEINPGRPDFEGDAEAALALGSVIELSGSGLAAQAGNDSAILGRGTATVKLGPWISAFGSITAGTSLIPRLESPAEPDTLALAFQPSELFQTSDDAGWRAGGELSLGSARAGGAYFHSELGSVLPFYLPFDFPLDPVAGGTVDGFEAYVEMPIPLTRDLLGVSGWYTRVLDFENRPYTPVEFARGSLRAGGEFYGGQFEPSAELTGLYRGQSYVPDIEDPTAYELFDASQTLHFSLQLRILDVRAFLLWDNLLNDSTALELPGSPQSLPRIVYGAEWLFRN